MSMLGTALRAALLGNIARGLLRRWGTQAAVALAVALTATMCVALALGFGGWALFAALSQTQSPATAAAATAGAFVLLALLTVGVFVMARRSRRRRAPEFAQLAALAAGIELPKDGAPTMLAGGLALGLMVGFALLRPRRS